MIETLNQFWHYIIHPIICNKTKLSSGYDKLIFYNHFLVATCGTLVRHGNIGANVNHCARWSEAYPLTDDDIELDI